MFPDDDFNKFVNKVILVGAVAGVLLAGTIIAVILIITRAVS